MPDIELILEILHQIYDAAKKVVLRFQVINNPNEPVEPVIWSVSTRTLDQP